MTSAEKTAKQVKHSRPLDDQGFLPESLNETLNFEFPDHYSEYDEEHDCIVNKFVKQNLSESYFMLEKTETEQNLVEL